MVASHLIKAQQATFHDIPNGMIIIITSRQWILVIEETQANCRI